MTSHAMPTAEEEWINAERAKVIAYLSQQGCKHGGVAEWPAFHVHPCIALWAVQSLNTVGHVGWWAVSGDIPTDYMSSTHGRHPREAMRYFSSQWLVMSDNMARGEACGYGVAGTPGEWEELAPLLKTRAEILRRYADDDALWED